MLRSIFLSGLFCCTLYLLPAQSPAVVKRNGEKAFSDGRWATAKALLSEYQAQKPGDLQVLAKLGISNFHLGQGAEARRLLEYVVGKTADPDILFYYAFTLHGLSDWERAIQAYKAFLRACGEKHPYKAQAADQIRRCVNGMGIRENNMVALVENLGAAVNTPGDEFAPLPSLNHPGKLYYAAARNGCNGGLRNDEGYEDTERGHWCSDMFAAKLNNTGWEGAGSLGGLLNTSRFEVPLGFNADGQVLFFFRGLTTYSGFFYADTAARKDEYSLEPPPFLSAMEPENGDCHPYFFDENTVVFASRRAGGFGGLDLWYSVRNDSTWTAPQNLGAAINTAYDETTPYLAPDGRSLYFSSNRPESIGGLDVFSSVFEDEKGTWTLPQNMGQPINSPLDDAFFRLTIAGDAAFLASDRFGYYGRRDLFIVYFKEMLSAQIGARQPRRFMDAGRNSAMQAIARTVVLPTILYERDQDLSAPEAFKTIQEAAQAALQHPEARVQVTVFSDEVTQLKFDLYYGIKRAEIVGKALIAQGVPPHMILLKSVGTAYPLAMKVVEGAPNPQAAKINQRVEITFHHPESLGFDFQLQRPQVAAVAAAGGIRAWDAQTQGLVFRVEAAVTRQLLSNDAIGMFSDIQIESPAGSGEYHYTVGSFSQYEAAAQTMLALQNAGFTQARILAYVHNVPLSKAAAVGMLKKYPVLSKFIKG